MPVEPISLLTGIPDLIERCIQGYNFLKDVKDAPKACSELVEALKSARADLKQLQEHLNRAENKETVQLSLQNCEKTLDELDSILKVYGNPEFKFNPKTRLKWALSVKKEIKALCDGLKQNVGILRPLLLNMAKDIGEMSKRHEETNAKIDEMNKRQQEADAKKVADELVRRLQEVVRWLEPLHSEVKLREVREHRQPGTCEWLLSHDLFALWYSSGSFLWLNGIPGNGKTVLTSFVIDHLKKGVTSDEIILFAFADFQNVRSTNVVVLLRALLAQILERYELENFVKDFAELETLVQQHADPPKSVNYLIQLLEKASGPWKRVFIVIDALDECVQTSRREFIAAIRNLVSPRSKFSIFVTSRAEQDIVDVLRSVPTISLVNETQSVKDDIRRFIEVKMNNPDYFLLTDLPEPVRARISSTLLEKANGMFRLVDCQLQSLAEVDFENDIDEILRNLPPDLNSMYERIFQRVKSKDQRAVKIVQHTLWWLVGSHRQLRLEELMEAVMVETGRDSPNTDLKPLSGKRLLGMCSSLVRYDAKTDILTLSHASVQEFLLSDHLKATAYHNYHIPSFFFLHRHITSLVSTYLHYGEFQNGPCTTPQLFLERLEQHPLLAYVASSWHLHIVKMYETCSESAEHPPDIDTFISLFDDSEENLLAQRSRRQFSYVFKDPRDAKKHLSWGEDFGGSSELEEQPLEMFSSPLYEPEMNLVTQHSRGQVSYSGTDPSDAVEYRSHEYDLCDDISGFVSPRHCVGPSWLVAEKGLLNNGPWRILSNTTPLQELDYMIYPLVSEGSPSLVRDLLCKLPKFKDRPLFYFGTPLMISIFANKTDTIKMLLQEFRVDVNKCAPHHCSNHQTVSPIFLAVKYGLVEVVELLLQCGSNTVFPVGQRLEWLPLAGPPSDDSYSYIIIGAVNHGRADILQILINHGVDVNTRSSASGKTVFHVAIRYGHIDSVKVLVDAGCDISPRSQGQTPLDLALNQQSSDLVQYLLDKGVSFDQCLPHSFKGLSWAVGERWYPEAREYLAKLKGNANSQQGSDNNEVAGFLTAGMWTVTSAERHELVKVTEDSPRETYISTTLPITGSPENPVRQIVFTTVSHDQGWSSDDTHGGGMYSGSFTWFEAEAASSPGVFMRIQDNVRADSQYRTHVNVWNHQDAPPLIKEWMANIKSGDTISVYPRARFRCWVNYVQSVKIDVYTARVQEGAPISEISL